MEPCISIGCLTTLFRLLFLLYIFNDIRNIHFSRFKFSSIFVGYSRFHCAISWTAFNECFQVSLLHSTLFCSASLGHLFQACQFSLLDQCMYCNWSNSSCCCLLLTSNLVFCKVVSEQWKDPTTRLFCDLLSFFNICLTRLWGDHLLIWCKAQLNFLPSTRDASKADFSF